MSVDEAREAAGKALGQYAADGGNFNTWDCTKIVLDAFLAALPAAGLAVVPVGDLAPHTTNEPRLGIINWGDVEGVRAIEKSIHSFDCAEMIDGVAAEKMLPKPFTMPNGRTIHERPWGYYTKLSEMLIDLLEGFCEPLQIAPPAASPFNTAWEQAMATSPEATAKAETSGQTP